MKMPPPPGAAWLRPPVPVRPFALDGDERIDRLGLVGQEQVLAGGSEPEREREPAEHDIAASEGAAPCEHARSHSLDRSCGEPRLTLEAPSLADGPRRLARENRHDLAHASAERASSASLARR